MRVSRKCNSEVTNSATEMIICDLEDVKITEHQIYIERKLPNLRRFTRAKCGLVLIIFR